MVMRNIIRKILIAGLVLGAGNMANAKEGPKTLMGASAQALADTCAGCHGTDGTSGGPATPTIGGLSKAYLVDLMNGFKSGDIPSTIMGRIAKGYNEEEINKLATYFAAQKFVPAKQKFDAEKAAKGAKLHASFCERCHSDGGSFIEDDTGRLSGQWTPYLKSTLADFLAGRRNMTRKMRKRLQKLHAKGGDAAIAELEAYYASQQ